MSRIIPVFLGLLALIINAGCSALAPEPSLDTSISELLAAYGNDLSTGAAFLGISLVLA